MRPAGLSSSMPWQGEKKMDSLSIQYILTSEHTLTQTLAHDIRITCLLLLRFVFRICAKSGCFSTEDVENLCVRANETVCTVSSKRVSQIVLHTKHAKLCCVRTTAILCMYAHRNGMCVLRCIGYT